MLNPPGYDPTDERPRSAVVNTCGCSEGFRTPASANSISFCPTTAVRQGVSVEDEAVGWTGNTRIARGQVAEPNPPAEMKKRWPRMHAVEGGPANRLGARALHLHKGEPDPL